MIDPGRLRTRLVLEAPEDSDDGQGGVVRGFVPVAQVWARVAPGAAHDEVDADGDGAVVRLRLVLRKGVTLTRRHRFRDDAKIYRIIAWRSSADGGFVEIDAEWRID